MLSHSFNALVNNLSTHWSWYKFDSDWLQSCTLFWFSTHMYRFYIFVCKWSYRSFLLKSAEIPEKWENMYSSHTSEKSFYFICYSTLQLFIYPWRNQKAGLVIMPIIVGPEVTDFSFWKIERWYSDRVITCYLCSPSSKGFTLMLSKHPVSLRFFLQRTRAKILYVISRFFKVNHVSEFSQCGLLYEVIINCIKVTEQSHYL